MGVRLRSAVSPVTPAIIGSRRPRHRIGLKAPPVRFQPAATSTPAPVACGWHRGAIFMGCAQLTHGRFTRALVGEQAPAPVLAWLSDRTTETRNYGETDREHLLRPEVEVVFGRDVRRCLPTARFVPFLQPEAATRAGGLHRRAPRRHERNGGALDRGCPTSCLPTHGPWSSTAAKTVDLAAAIAQTGYPFESGRPMVAAFSRQGRWTAGTMATRPGRGGTADRRPVGVGLTTRLR